MKDPAKIGSYKAVNVPAISILPCLYLGYTTSPCVNFFSRHEAKAPQKLRNSNTVWDVPSHSSKELLQNSLGVLAMSWGAPGVILRLKETVHSSWPSCKFSLARNMHFLLSLMSKGTWMVRTSVWMLQSRPLNVWCRVSDAGAQQSS